MKMSKGKCLSNTVTVLNKGFFVIINNMLQQHEEPVERTAARFAGTKGEVCRAPGDSRVC